MISIRSVNADDPLAVEAMAMPSRVAGPVDAADAPEVLLVALTNHPAGDRPAGCIAIRFSDESGTAVITRFGIDPQMRGLELRRRLVAEAEMFAFGESGASRLHICALPGDKEFFLAMGWGVDADSSETADAAPMVVSAETPGGPGESVGE